MDDRFNHIGPALARVGEEILRVIGGKVDGIFLYAEVGDGWVDQSLYCDGGNAVHYYDSGDSEIWRLVLDAWHLEPGDKRWTAMHYSIKDGQFDARFEFDDLEGSDEDTTDRRERILRQRYGDKPIIYPPMPDGSFELTSTQVT